MTIISTITQTTDLSLDDVPGVGDAIVILLLVILHSLLHVGVDNGINLASILSVNRNTMLIRVHLVLQFVSSDPRPDLHEEDDAQQHGEGEGHAVILLDGAATPEEGDKEDDAAHDDQEHGGGEELVPEKVEILGVGTLNNSSSHNQEQPRELHRVE